MKRIVPAALIPALLAPQPAQALCAGLDLSGVPATVTYQGSSGEYNVFDPAEYMQTVNFSVLGNIAVGTCSYFITLGPGGTGNPSQRKLTRGGDTLKYNIYTSGTKSNILKDIATAGGVAEVVTGTFPTGLGQTKGHSISWTIEPLQPVLAGTTPFEDTALELKLYEGILGLYLLSGTKTITFRAKAESSVDIALVDTGGAFSTADNAQTVDFGTLTSGETLSFDTVIRSNDGYLVTMQSANKQNLKHKALADTIPYSVAFDGGAINLTSGAAAQAIASSHAVTNAAGSRFETKFTVGTVTGAEAAGDYQDVITITVSAY